MATTQSVTGGPTFPFPPPPNNHRPTPFLRSKPDPDTQPNYPSSTALKIQKNQVDKEKEREAKERKEQVNRKIASQKAISVILRREATKAVIEKKKKKKGISSKRLLPRTVLEALHERITALRWDSALKVFELMREQLWYRPNPDIYIKLIVMLGKCKQPQKAHELFLAMGDEGCVIDHGAYTALLSAYSRSCQFDEAFSLLEHMKNSTDCRPDVYTYSIFIKSCLQVFAFDKVRMLLLDMVSQGIKPNTVTYNTLIDAYGKAGNNVLVKGGDLPASLDAVDVFFDGENLYELCSARIKTRNTHGTGCTLASSIAAELAKGLPMLSAIKVAKRFVESILDYGKELSIGTGPQGPLDHLLKLKGSRSVAPNAFGPSDLFLYAVTDSGMNKKWGRSIKDAVKAAIDGGATIVQLREKDLETRDFIEAAKECVSICHLKGIPILINDRVDVALACNADGVHVGQSDMPVPLVRSLLGPEKIIGISCKTPEQAHEAWISGADYIGSGGVFPTNTKANNRTIGLDGLKEVCLASKLPVVAIGGIGASNAQSVMEIDAPNLQGVAVVSGLFNAECVLSATKQLHEILKQTVETRK